MSWPSKAWRGARTQTRKKRKPSSQAPRLEPGRCDREDLANYAGHSPRCHSRSEGAYDASSLRKSLSRKCRRFARGQFRSGENRRVLVPQLADVCLDEGLHPLVCEQWLCSSRGRNDLCGCGLHSVPARGRAFVKVAFDLLFRLVVTIWLP